MSKKIFCFDLDNTLCTTYRGKYGKSKPKKKAINKVNQLFEKGHIIKIYTARYMGRYNDKIPNKREIRMRISNQLNKFGIKYHKLFISKPSADIYVDDKAFGYNKSWIKKY